MVNLQVRVLNVPSGVPAPTDFTLAETPVPAPRKGEMLCRALWLSLDPFLRARFDGRRYPESLAPGGVMPARAICEVVDSRNEVFNVGELVVMDAGLQSYCVSEGVHVQRVKTGGAPLTTALGVMGAPGLTAYCGLLDLAGVRAGESVLVSAAAGAVGSMVGQIARIKGCKVIGIAGTREKVDWCVKQAHFSACVNYRTEHLSQRLEQLAPDGVDVYFDNCGGDILDTIVSGGHVRGGGRVVLCGVARADKAAASEDSTPMHLQPRVLPMVPHEFEHRRDAFLKDAIAWFAEGHLRYKEDIVEGLQHAAEHFCRLMRGENFGKALVKA